MAIGDVLFLPWLLAANKINTKNMIKRRHWNVADGVNCALCDRATEETVEDLFFDCPFSAQCWDSINMHWENAGNRLTKIHSGKEASVGPLFMEVFLAAAWCIWKEHNDKIFKRIPHLVQSWKRRFKSDLILLTQRVKPSLVVPFQDFVASVI